MMEPDATIKADAGDTVIMVNPFTHGMNFPDESAVRNFFETRELVLAMADFVPHHCLPSLCRVNKRFNIIFSQRLYEHIHLSTEFLRPEVVARNTTNGRFQNTKTLTFDTTTPFHGPSIRRYDYANGGYYTIPSSEWICVLVQRVATGILRNAPNLHTINLDGGRIGSSRAVLVLNNGLKPRYTSFEKEKVNSDDEEDPPKPQIQSLTLSLGHVDCCPLSTSIFEKQNLKSLCLLDIPESWGPDVLCNILTESPELRYLELSFLYGDINFERICRDFKQLGGAPLKLEVLILGQSICLRTPQSPALSVTGGDPPARASYLALLTDPARIKEMGIVAADGIAWDTFDSTFLPMLKSFYISAPARGGNGAPLAVQNFFNMSRARDFLRQVHLHLRGSLFQHYPNFKVMTQKFFAPRDDNDPTSVVSPLGFSFQFCLPREHKYKRSVALPLPTTRCLDIAIHHHHLVGFAAKGLKEMSALETLGLTIYWYDQNLDRAAVEKKQLEALEQAATTCPNLRYVRMKMNEPSQAPSSLNRSWEIFRERKPGSRSKKLFPKFKLLDARTDKQLRPWSMWSDQEKMNHFVKDYKLPLNYCG